MVKQIIKQLVRSGDNVVVRPRMPLRFKIVLAVVAVAVVAGLIHFSYQYGLARAGFVRAEADRARTELRGRIRDLEVQNSGQQEMLARVERQLQIDSTAYKELDQALAESTRQIADLREELNFYRNIIAPGDQKSGLQIQDLKLESAGLPGHFRYKLVLIQAFNHKNMVRGRAEIGVGGVEGGEQRTIRIENTRETPLDVSFRYYQNLEGVLSLPPGFEPQRVRVSVLPGGSGSPMAERAFDWPRE